MPYVKRNEQGEIVLISKERQSDQDEELELSDSELVAFISDGLPAGDPLAFLLHSDVDISRVLEDLIDLLVGRGIINFTDLPDSAQNKLLGRRKARAALRDSDSTLLVDDDLLKL